MIITDGRARRVIEVEAASRERERLARDIHDPVLQVLAMVQRRGAEAGGAAPGGAGVPGSVDVRATMLSAQTDRVTVTIRDDGPGIPDGRLAETAAAGRLGISHSIRGRLRDLGSGRAVAGGATGGVVNMLMVFYQNISVVPLISVLASARPGT